ncbi:MAG: hypothetical protein JJU22_11220 [Gammaproteobacteria bacterium]|nr:hypothetical protein [Gammaproteobacteria bacterium]
MNKFALLFMGLLLISACTVQSQQLDMARQVMPRGGDSVDVEQFAWQVRFNDTEFKVYSISVGGGIVFANEQGLEVAFDGWDVLIVSGMPGSLGMIRVDKSGSPRVHHVQGLDDAFEVHCEEPRRSGNGWHTRCQHERDGRAHRMDHRISLTEDGRISRIEASLIPGVGPMVITPLFDIGN